MKNQTIKKTLPVLFIITLFIIPANATITTTTEQTDNQIEPTKYIQEQILEQLSNNGSNRYITISAGIRATSFFLKVPRPLTQRGIIFIAEIKYRSPLAFTLVIQRSLQGGFSIAELERGTHRLIYFGLGHAAFSRPHVGSFGRLIGTSSAKPIVF